jgi:hypothetical protein
MMRRLALPALLLLGLAAPAGGQELGNVVDRVAASWSRGDASGIVAHAARTGISLDVDGERVGPIAARQAAAVLRRVFDQRESVRASAGRARVVGGSPEKGFGEIAWTSRARGTTIPERATVVLAFVREDGHWRITEIRLMR